MRESVLEPHTESDLSFEDNQHVVQIGPQVETQESALAVSVQASIGPIPGLLHYPLRTEMSVAKRRLESRVTVDDRCRRYTTAYKLDAAGNPTGASIRFDFIGQIADADSGKPVYAAIASSDDKALAEFPKQVAIKMMRKVDVWPGRNMKKYMDYQTTVCEAQAMRALSVTGGRFAAGALATFQDMDYFYIVMARVPFHCSYGLSG